MNGPVQAMKRKSWYLPTDTIADLSATVDDLHFATRKPKHKILGVIIAVALSHQDEIRAKLTAGGEVD